jgi:hypothetical protein
MDLFLLSLLAMVKGVNPVSLNSNQHELGYKNVSCEIKKTSCTGGDNNKEQKEAKEIDDTDIISMENE